MSEGGEQVDVAIGVGSNIDAAANVPAAVEKLSGVGEVVAVSQMLTSAPVGRTDQPAFTNGAVRLRTSLSEGDLKQRLLKIEADLGRVRDPDDRCGPRTIDLDIIIYGDRPADDDLRRRWFVAVPVAEVWPDWACPHDGRTAREIAAGLPRDD